jgi:hypothetical protein
MANFTSFIINNNHATITITAQPEVAMTVT